MAGTEHKLPEGNQTRIVETVFGSNVTLSHPYVQERDVDPLSRNMTEAWLWFWFSFILLAALDFFCMAPKKSQLIPGRIAVAHCFFWFTVGLGFNVLIVHLYDWEVGVTWFNGYVLEYLLSLDNVFFFHVVFQTYATPETQIYKALYFGILGAVMLRLLFYVAGTEIFRMWWPIQLLFGGILIWSGYKTAFGDEEEEDPKDNVCVRLVTTHLPFAEVYDDGGLLLMDQLAVANAASQHNGAVVGEPIGCTDSQDLQDVGEPKHSNNGTPLERQSRRACCGGRLGSMLLLVVIVLWMLDLVFAVDSVTAKIATFDNVFINFSSSAFAMLCLRALYFVLIELMSLFWALKYGVALILVLVGVKVSIGHWIEIEELYATASILAIFAISMVVSLLVEEPSNGDDDEGKEPDRALPATPAASPESRPTGHSGAEAETPVASAGGIELGQVDDTP
mmetsp:Transcript_44053/g.101652  ORF Transcript_44053/g.101652 Transcript_44053/m.101652 type:complete len:450 (+) Transcript_44053:119-1468(+)